MDHRVGVPMDHLVGGPRDHRVGVPSPKDHRVMVLSPRYHRVGVPSPRDHLVGVPKNGARSRPQRLAENAFARISATLTMTAAVVAAQIQHDLNALEGSGKRPLPLVSVAQILLTGRNA